MTEDQMYNMLAELADEDFAESEMEYIEDSLCDDERLEQFWDSVRRLAE